MAEPTRVRLSAPYLILIGDLADPTYAKTGLGIVDWRPDLVGTSLSMAPAFVLAQLCDFVDIDGPLLLKYDQPYGLDYQQGVVDVFDPQLWG